MMRGLIKKVGRRGRLGPEGKKRQEGGAWPRSPGKEFKRTEKGARKQGKSLWEVLPRWHKGEKNCGDVNLWLWDSEKRVIR